MKKEIVEIDENGRPVIRRFVGGVEKIYYVGPDANGYIEKDDRGEYIIVNGEKRYWQGILRRQEVDVRLTQSNDLGFAILKPDVFRLGLYGYMVSLITEQDLHILLEKNVRFDKELVLSMYPYFYEAEWERNLLEYFTSGTSACLLLKGHKAVEKISRIRARTRSEFSKRNCHPTKNLFHAPDSQNDAARELLLIFSEEEIVRFLEGA